LEKYKRGLSEPSPQFHAPLNILALIFKCQPRRCLLSWTISHLVVASDIGG
jgi:hypothetical protein